MSSYSQKYDYRERLYLLSLPISFIKSQVSHYSLNYPHHWTISPQTQNHGSITTSAKLVVFYFFLFIVVLCGGTLWHLQRFLQCINYV
jgi:hypothetical protein